MSAAVRSDASVDVNVKLFEIMGRAAMRGLWMLWSRGGAKPLPELQNCEDVPGVKKLAEDIVLLINNNPALLSPVSDDQAIDIGATLIFLTMLNAFRTSAGRYVEALIQRIVWSYRRNNIYPTTQTDYRELAGHPRERTTAYRESQTKGSTLIPLLSLWAVALGASQAADYLAAFCAEHLKHCNTQLWFPNHQSEQKLYIGASDHGATLSRVPRTADAEKAFKILDAECSGKTSFAELSAVRFGHWPLVILACRHHRLPIPPNIWLKLLHQCKDKSSPVPAF